LTAKHNPVPASIETDGGFTDWTQQLLSKRKERLLTSGMRRENCIPARMTGLVPKRQLTHGMTLLYQFLRTVQYLPALSSVAQLY